MSPRFRKKPVVVEAIRWCGTNFVEINTLKPGWMSFSGDTLNIETLEGTMKAALGDWIIKGVKDEVYPCKPDIFKATYEGVE